MTLCHCVAVVIPKMAMEAAQLRACVEVGLEQKTTANITAVNEILVIFCRCMTIKVDVGVVRVARYM